MGRLCVGVFCICLFVAIASSSFLTGVTPEDGLAVVDVVRANIVTGANATLSKSGPSYVARQSLGTTDTKKNLFYTIYLNIDTDNYELVAFDTQGNNQTTELTFIPATFLVGMGQFLNYDPNTGNLWLGYFSDAGVHVIGSYDVSSNKFTQLTTIDTTIGLVWPSTAFDPKSKVLVTQYAFESGTFTIGFDTTTGKVLYNVSDSTLSLSPFDFDINSGLLYGYTFVSSQPFLTSVDPISAKILSKTQVNFYGYVSNILVDTQNKQLVSMLQLSPLKTHFALKPRRTVLTSKRGKQEVVMFPSSQNAFVVCDPECRVESIVDSPLEDVVFNFVAYDLATAKVASSAEFCIISLNSTTWTCPYVIGRVLPK